VGDGGGWGRGRAVLVVARVAGAILIREVWYGRGRVVVSWRLQAISTFMYRSVPLHVPYKFLLISNKFCNGWEQGGPVRNDL
jgi:hypothetical protein